MQANTFDLGDKGEELVYYGLQKLYKDPRKVPKEINQQLVWGDIAVGGLAALGLENLKYEVKTEMKHTGNVFWERWSNKAAQREGWGWTSPADELFYLFWEEGKGYRFRDLQTVMWLVDYYKDKFNLVQQKKYAQANDSWGYLIPIEWFRESGDIVEFDFNRLKQEMAQ